jgi:hypothetical protein
MTLKLRQLMSMSSSAWVAVKLIPKAASPKLASALRIADVPAHNDLGEDRRFILFRILPTR